MPESVRDRCTKAHEYIFLLSKSERYYFDNEAIKVPASSSFANDKRHRTGSNLNNDKVGYEEAGAQNPKGPHRLFGKSGNKERKQRPSQDVLNHGAQAGSVPWEGMTANRRSVWTVTTKPYKGAHFATFPPDLIEPCILAGTSERGHCPDCGERWAREVDKTTSFHGGSGAAGRTADEVNASGKLAGKQYGTNLKLGPRVSSETIGRQPSCDCGAEPVPDTVLDPFMGSGTTAAVAVKHGRQYRGCELNPAYGELQMARIAAANDDVKIAAREAEFAARQLDLLL